jgi:hypothetical protein
MTLLNPAPKGLSSLSASYLHLQNSPFLVFGCAIHVRGPILGAAKVLPRFSILIEFRQQEATYFIAALFVVTWLGFDGPGKFRAGQAICADGCVIGTDSNSRIRAVGPSQVSNNLRTHRSHVAGQLLAIFASRHRILSLV